MSDPIATYSEKRFDGWRKYELHHERMLVSGVTYLRAEFNFSVALANLDYNYGRIRARNPLFGLACWLTVIGFLGTLLLGELVRPRFTSVGAMFFESLLIGGIVFCFATARKVNIVRFNGATPICISECGNDKNRFQEFVGFVAEQIRHAPQKLQRE
jgi:hypothetical protein